MSSHSTYRWSSHDFRNRAGCLSFSFAATTDALLFTSRAVSASSADEETVRAMQLHILQSALFLTADMPTGRITLDMEDTTGVADGAAHLFTMTFGDFGTRLYLDGYQCFSCATNLGSQELGKSGVFEFPETDTTVRVENFSTSSAVPSADAIAAMATLPIPDIEFSAAYLASRDLATVTTLRTGTLFARFRVRGPKQYGTLLAAGVSSSENDSPVFAITVDEHGFALTAGTPPHTETYKVPGAWDDGDWHDLVVRASRGAMDIYVDGNREIHQPGQVFFGDFPQLHRIAIGEDLRGVRLMGEIRNGGIFTRALNDSEIKKISGVTPLTTTTLYDAGYAGSASYRIPSLITTPSGTVIAGADQRVYISNDAPNKINFVIRRSLDGGYTWQPMQTVLDYAGGDIEGASAIDSCMVCDARTGRIVVLIDHYPGGIGLVNNTQEIGVDATGRLILEDHEGNHFILLADDSVAHAVHNASSNSLIPGKATDYRVDERGNVTRAGKPAGNIYLKQGKDPHETLLEVRTGFVVEIHSDDEGATWSQPRQLNHMIKEPWMHFIGTCPGNGIQLREGKHQGRLLIPYYFTGESLGHYSSGALFSDDGGATWKRGRALTEGKRFNGHLVDPQTFRDDDASTSESVFIERADGAVVCFARNQNHNGRVAKAVSTDGGYSWDSLEFDPALPDIFSQPNALKIPATSGELSRHDDDVVFANASKMLPYRGCGMLYLSRDGARTWSARRCFNPYHYVYQCMSMLPDTAEPTIGLLWERETAGVYFTRIPLPWLEATENSTRFRVSPRTMRSNEEE